jgi:hypothetical protein
MVLIHAFTSPLCELTTCSHTTQQQQLKPCSTTFSTDGRCCRESKCAGDCSFEAAVWEETSVVQNMQHTSYSPNRQAVLTAVPFVQHTCITLEPSKHTSATRAKLGITPAATF